MVVNFVMEDENYYKFMFFGDSIEDAFDDQNFSGSGIAICCGGLARI